jgi:hypothetical protein
LGAGGEQLRCRAYLPDAREGAPGKGIAPRVATVFELVIDEKVYRVEGKALQFGPAHGFSGVHS